MVYTPADFLKDAQGGKFTYEQNDERLQNVRVWGDTAVATAKLWEKGTEHGKPFEHLFCFSDPYVPTRGRLEIRFWPVCRLLVPKAALSDCNTPRLFSTPLTSQGLRPCYPFRDGSQESGWPAGADPD
jgi:hypothetical protein